MSEKIQSTPSHVSNERPRGTRRPRPKVLAAQPKFVLIYPLAEKTMPLAEYPAALAEFAEARKASETHALNFGDTAGGGWWMVAAPTDKPTEVLAVICKGLPTEGMSLKADRQSILPVGFDEARVESYCTDHGFSYDKRPPSTRVFMMAELLSGKVESKAKFEALLKELDERTAQFTLWYSEEGSYCSILTDDQAVLSLFDSIRFAASPAEQLAAKNRTKILLEILRKHRFGQAAGATALDNLDERLQLIDISLLSTIEPGQSTQVVTRAGKKLDAWRVQPVANSLDPAIINGVPTWPSWVLVHLAKSYHVTGRDDFASPGWLVKLQNGRVLRFREDDFAELFDTTE